MTLGLEITGAVVAVAACAFGVNWLAHAASTDRGRRALPRGKALRAAEKSADDRWLSRLRITRLRQACGAPVVWPLTRARVTVAALHGVLARQDWSAPSPRLPQLPGLTCDVPLIPLPLTEQRIPVVRSQASRQPWDTATVPAATKQHA